ncbi:GNAT family N-acetyltransferase [Vibrio sp. SCSIO 43136]|uniref:GNAT family N-acetyltransferase n=1 Tax=Vibrio sp. SCSIO 43136 TaxID=2819101 RepID=UPI0020755DAE|nr:GNAT family N-acetyltransferase [Vibrio sp. SCSIO 43136]USD67824.1 GNAT family N-acetyltransferase [Vibrio sp. SCSIO 43136]
MAWELEFIVDPSDEVKDFIYKGLLSFNLPNFPEEEIEKIACVAKSPQGEIVGGLTGDIFTNTLFIEYLWLDESQRGSGLGTQLVQMAESKAKEKGVTDIYLDTYSFQAKDFYLKLGFEIVGKYSGFPTKGVDKYFLQKAVR